MRVRRSSRRRAGRRALLGVAGFVADVAASPLVLCRDCVRASRRLHVRSVLRFALLLACVTLAARPRPDGSEQARLRWLDRTLGATESVSQLPYADSINKHSSAAGLDPRLTAAVVEVESGFQSDAVSPKGAVGLMQVMPATWREVAGWALPVSQGGRGTIPSSPTAMLDPDLNLRVGTTYLARMLEACDGHVGRALAAYNGGLSRLEGVRARVAGADMDSEPARYVAKVYLAWDTLCDRESPPLPVGRNGALVDATLWLCGTAWCIAFAWAGMNCVRWVSNPRALRRRIRW